MTEHTHRALEAEAACTELFPTKLICEEKKKSVNKKHTEKQRELRSRRRKEGAMRICICESF